MLFDFRHFNPDQSPEAARVGLIYAETPIALLGNLIGGGILAYLANQVSLDNHSWVWFAILVGILILRGINYLAFNQNHHHDQQHEAWLKRAFIGTLATGIFWGAGMVLFYEISPIESRLVYLLIVAGLSSAAIIYAGAYFSNYLAFLLPMLLPIAVLHFQLPMPHSELIGILIFSYILGMSGAAYLLSQIVSATFQFRQDKYRLGKELRDANAALRALDTIDAGTGLPNQRYVKARFPEFIADHNRNQKPLALILIEPDQFSTLFSEDAAQSNDVLLKPLGQLLRSILPRQRDLVTRFDENQILIILPKTDLEGAAAVSARIHSRLATARLGGVINPLNADAESSPNRVTVSIGISSHIPDSEANYQTTLLRAQTALQDAHEAGSNCTMFAK